MRKGKINVVDKRETITEENQRLRQLAISSLEELKKRKNEKIKYDLKNQKLCGMQKEKLPITKK